MTEDLHQTVPARPESLGEIRAAIADLCERLDLDDAVATDVRLAVSEACANVMLHAYRGAATGDVEVDAEPEADQLRVVVRDTGPGIRPRRDSPGAGLGLPLIAALAARVEVRRRPRPSATELVMTFPLRRRRRLHVLHG